MGTTGYVFLENRDVDVDELPREIIVRGQEGENVDGTPLD